MQPYLFPYIGYFHTIKAVDDYVIYDDVQFIKGGWINRNNILIGNQKSQFTISLSDASANKKINDIEIKDDFSKFLKTLAMAYSRAPYKEVVLKQINDICNYKDKNLARFVGNSIQQITKYLNIQTNFIYSSDLEKDSNIKAQDKVIAICEELDAEIYINAIGGQELYNKDIFKQHGIELNYMKSELVEYRQFSKDFVPYLSIIDVMMFNSPEEINVMLDKYELI
jgi:hypothetical protein